MKFKAGNNANPLGAGAAREKRISRALLQDILAEMTEEITENGVVVGRSNAERIARRGVQEAINGDIPMIKTMLEYAFGKPDQSINVSMRETVDVDSVIEKLGGAEAAKSVLSSIQS